MVPKRLGADQNGVRKNEAGGIVTGRMGIEEI